jgi:hypothetical protein
MQATWAWLQHRRIVTFMDHLERCALCGEAVESGQAWMANEMTGGVAHAGCVYRDEREPERRERWQPSEIARIRAPEGTRKLTRR